jgi:hypothetical protein
MFAAAKLVQICKAMALCLIVPLLALQFFSCGKHDFEGDNFQKGKVTFYNESSYNVSIHESSFSGYPLVEKLAPGNSFSVELNPSNNYGSGTVFSIKYWYLVANGTELSCGDVWTGGIDPNMQISQNIISGKSYVIQISSPSKLELREAFIKIINMSNNSIEFNYLGNFFKQAGCNGELPVPSGKTGTYRVSESFGEVEIKGYTITQGFEQYSFPDLVAKNGYVYNYEFNGNSIIKKGEQNLIF